jgi:hypothetical protein
MEDRGRVQRGEVLGLINEHKLGIVVSDFLMDQSVMIGL